MLRNFWRIMETGHRRCLAPGLVCFSLESSPFPIPLQLEPLHFEALFCLAGAVTLTRKNGSALTVGARQVLLLTDLSDLAGVRADFPLAGVLVERGRRGARESLKAVCSLLGGLTLDTGRVRRWMADRGRLRCGGTFPLEPGGFCRPGTPAPGGSGGAGVCGSRWNCSTCSQPRRNRLRTRPWRLGGRLSGRLTETADTWRNT